MIVAHAPARISFAGGGTDLPAYYERFGGLVISSAIDRGCWVIARDPGDDVIRLSSASFNASATYRLGETSEVDDALAFPAAVVEHAISRGWLRIGIDLSILSEVPPGTGLGSSSAVLVALIRAVAAYCERGMTAQDVAELASYLEIGRLAKPIGMQDQFASAFGGLNAIAFQPDGVRVSPLRVSQPFLEELDRWLLLFATGRTRQSSEILNGQRRETEDNPSVIDGLHQLKALASEVRAALEAEDLERFGDLLDTGWRIKCRLSRKISTGQIDGWYSLARQAGALGGKLCGAGGGGYLLLCCPPERQSRLREALAGAGLVEFSFGIGREGASVISRAPERALVVAG